MNRDLLRGYISEYKRNFAVIDREEIYKWRAVKQFQVSWNPGAEDFAEMLSVSLSKTYNLMDSGNYFPRRMIVAIARRNPQEVRRAFLALFDEDEDLIDRITSFRARIRELNTRHNTGKKDYQDYRAVMVYLNLRYPDNYYFYKWGMFKSICEKLECDFAPKMGSRLNIIQYHELCIMVREEITLDNELLKLHVERIGQTEYFDANYNILTQDLIYAITRHLDVGEVRTATQSAVLTFRPAVLAPKHKDYRFEGRFSDHISRQKRNKRIGDFGEELVLEHEKTNCDPAYVPQISHVSKTEGDGLGCTSSEVMGHLKAKTKRDFLHHTITDLQSHVDSIDDAHALSFP